MNPLAIVTGAGTGIGRALAERMIACGCDILAIGRRATHLESLAAAHPARVAALPLDVAAADAPRRVLDALGERQARFVVHNAAALEPAGPLEKLDRSAFGSHMETNLVAPLFLTQALLPRLEEGARVLHVSSGAAHRAINGWGPYCVSKAALHMLTQCWNAELDARRVLVGSARPGVVDTPMQQTIRDLSPEDFPDVEAFRRMKSDGALLPPEDVARFLAWMLLDADAERFAGAERDIRDPDIEPLWRA
jgi:benzil reductase ((S)-benzoin forming)